MGNFYTSRLSEDELMHYGVLGMKWGQRRAQKKEYGMSKRQVKKAIRKAKRNYRKANDPYMFNGVTGKNYKNVRNEHEKAIKSDKKHAELSSKRNKEYALAERYQNEADAISRDIDNKRSRIQSEYVTKSEKRKLAYQVKDLTSKAGDAYNRVEKHQNLGDSYASEVNARGREIGKKYANAYKEAVLKDINYSDIEKGKKMLDAYGIKVNKRYF